MASPAFDLAVQGILNFARFGRVLSQRKIAHDPLNGVIDGTNTTFFTNYFPVLTSGSFGVFVGGFSVPGSADYDTGEVNLTTAPDTQPEATYTFTPFGATQLLQFVISGFDEMESRWTRGYKLVDASGNDADESSANIYVSDVQGADPLVGGPAGQTTALVFSKSRVQIAFLMACTEYRYYLSQLGQSGIDDFAFREGLRGMSVDKSKRPPNIQLALAEAEKNMMSALQRAQEAFYTGGEHFGGYVASPVTIEYATGFEWQTAAKTGNNRTLLGFNVAYRPLTYYP